MKRRFVTLIVTAAVFLAAQVQADTPAPYPSFTFKRVGLPGKSGGGRIKVQIDPVAQREALRVTKHTEPEETKAPDAVPDTPTVLSGLDWYWIGVSPKLEDSSPGRLDIAVSYLDKGPEGKTVPAPRLQKMQDIAEKYGVDILKATIGTDVSPALVLAVIGIESAGNRNAVSSAGASGLMQLMPDTAKRFGVEDATIAEQNIKGGVAYLDWLMKKFNRDPVLVLAGYNAGEGAVIKNGGVPPYAETRAYVPKVLAAWKVARGLCITPPELVTDGCVFAVRGLASND
ncbi:lytic transglycosylase domain-containing protein [Profundibacter amoris]|uniref:Lytic transglycosylase domain-containing protein n=1 Tax=Profundibacter amoris TaxID=2171755 RepID=A0A347UDY9_9RHOB|nr:lytic transglycosylase domain-containing protein [Profundibacter amoris]AXX97067.1 lytic transglycosylase domain-containing protein [Profundibacter amoris]